MAKFYSRAKMTSSTTGTGTLTLGAAANNSFFTFAEAGVANGDVVPYVIEDGLDFEYGIGTYTSSGTTLSRDTVRASKIGGTAGTSKINCSGTQIVYIDAANVDLFSKSEPVRRAISGADTIVANDYGHLVEITSGTFTLAFTAAATLGSGFQCVILNSGTGDVTLDPNSTEQIDGLTSWVLYPGGAILLTCTGSAFETVLLSPMRKQFDSSGTFTKPGVGIMAWVEAWGGGGSGGRGRSAATASGGAGGGGGAYKEHMFLLSAFGATETVTIGAGGAAQTVDSTAGNVGGNTTFGSLLTAHGGGGGGGGGNGNPGGGGGGAGMTAVGAVGAAGSGGTGGLPNPYFKFRVSADQGGSPVNIDYNIPFGQGETSNTDNSKDNFFGGGGGSMFTGSANPGGVSGYGGAGGGSGATGASAGNAGGSSLYGGGGGGGATVSGTAGAGGVSTYGGNGGAGGVGAGTGTAGSQPGGGGGGSENANSGAGGTGRIIVYMW